MYDEADLLAQTYWHKAEVKRPQSVKQGAISRFEDTVIYTDLSCAVSFTQGSTQGLSDTTQPVRYIATLFARPDIVIVAGDVVTATFENGRACTFLAGEGVFYPSHIEIPLLREGDADGK